MYGLYQIVYFAILDILRTFKSPFFILIVFLLYFYYRDNSRMPIIATINAIMFGAIGGIIATVLLLYMQVYLTPVNFIYILLVAIILSLIDTRFICFAYGGSIVVLSNLLFGFPKIDSYDLMLLVAVLHMVEAILIILNGSNQSEITYFSLGYDYIGGYKFNRMWPLPLVLFIGDTMIKPITIIALLSYGDFTISNLPKNKTIKSGITLFLYGLILLILTRYRLNPYLPPIIAIAGHESLIHLNKWREEARYSLFSTPNVGVRVLGVKQGSVAKKIGISKGDIVLEINDVIMKDEGDLQNIEMINPGIYKIKFFNLKRGIKNKTYKGNKETLGIITLPRVM